jgi:hypothetical protein
MAPLMELWGRKLVVRFAPMNGRTGHWACANCAIHAGIPCSRSNMRLHRIMATLVALRTSR